jgi:hypothetical protein
VAAVAAAGCKQIALVCWRELAAPDSEEANPGAWKITQPAIEKLSGDV